MLNHLLPYLPELIAFVSGIILLFIFSIKRFSFDVISSISFLVLIFILIISVISSPEDVISSSHLFSVSSFSIFFRIVIILSIILTFLFSSRARELPDRVAQEYSLMLFLFFIAASFMVMAENLLALYISMEILSLISYVCVSFDLERSRSQEAGIKYAIYGAVASSLMLFGISYIYGITGSLNYSEISTKLSSLNINNESVYLMILIVTLMIFGGLFFKLAAFPFYAWSPDAYEGGPTPFVALLSVGSKAAALGALIKVMTSIFVKSSQFSQDNVVIILGVVSILTMTLGNLMAINQNNLKRLLAYSSIAHAGYMIMALSAADTNAINAVKFYIVAYLLMNLGAFYCVQTLADRTGTEDIEVFNGLSSRSPYLAGMFTIFLLSLTGIPPFVGFVGKFYLFAVIINKGGGFYYILAIIGVLNSAISLYYYARIIRVMYLIEGSDETFVFDSVRRYTLGILGIATVLFGVYFSPILRFIEHFNGILR